MVEQCRQGDYDSMAEQLAMSKGSIGPTRIRCLQQLRAILEGLAINMKGDWAGGRACREFAIMLNSCIFAQALAHFNNVQPECQSA